VSKRFATALVISTREGQTLYHDAFRMLGFSKQSTFLELGRQPGGGRRMSYLLDSDVFIQAKNLHYGLDFCPAFWMAHRIEHRRFGFQHGEDRDEIEPVPTNFPIGPQPAARFLSQARRGDLAGVGQSQCLGDGPEV